MGITEEQQYAMSSSFLVELQRENEKFSSTPNVTPLYSHMYVSRIAGEQKPRCKPAKNEDEMTPRMPNWSPSSSVW